ncbi:MAG: preprotein translocase subunit YajC [Myxococcota bacterium]
MTYLIHTLLLAQEAPPEGGAGSIFQYLPLLLMFGVFYFLLIRPASQQRKQHAELLNQLKNGDEVSLNGGIYGKIVSIDASVATVEVAKNVKLKVLRDRIAGKWPTNPGADSSKSAAS